MQSADAQPVSTGWPTGADVDLRSRMMAASTAPVALQEAEHRRVWLEHVLQPDVHTQDLMPPARLVTLLQQVSRCCLGRQQLV